jgi:hypothetical protein
MHITSMHEAVLKVFPQLCPAASSSSTTREGYPRRVGVKRAHVLPTNLIADLCAFSHTDVFLYCSRCLSVASPRCVERALEALPSLCRALEALPYGMHTDMKTPERLIHLSLLSTTWAVWRQDEVTAIRVSTCRADLANRPATPSWGNNGKVPEERQPLPCSVSVLRVHAPGICNRLAYALF